MCSRFLLVHNPGPHLQGRLDQGLLGGAGLARAQSSTGSIAGNVKDTTGGALPGVTVEAASPALIEKVRTSVSDGAGQYRLDTLASGVYTVTYTLPGFATRPRSLRIRSTIMMFSAVSLSSMVDMT